jgi:REP element-mobilizing transposase RayT
MNDPVAYLLTCRGYGTKLPGEEGWIDRKNNQYNTPTLPADLQLSETIRREMSEGAFTFDLPEYRKIILQAFLEVCRHCGWQPHAIHVRVTHVHAVIFGVAAPERMLQRLKAISTQRLHEAGLDRKKIWGKSGSTVYLWNEEQLYHAVEYVLRGQGMPLECWPTTEPTDATPRALSEPTA